MHVLTKQLALHSEGLRSTYASEDEKKSVAYISMTIAAFSSISLRSYLHTERTIDLLCKASACFLGLVGQRDYIWISLFPQRRPSTRLQELCHYLRDRQIKSSLIIRFFIKASNTYTVYSAQHPKLHNIYLLTFNCHICADRVMQKCITANRIVLITFPLV